MFKTLIITEKPSVAYDIANAFGNFTKYKNFYENNEYVISFAIGHLIKIVAPEIHKNKKEKWNFSSLPIIPERFTLSPILKNKSHLNFLIKLIRRKDINCVINACDSGREGELIFRLIIQYSKSKHIINRLWLQSLTIAAIKEGFLNLRTDEEMKPLANAARCRLEADWLVGINGTRAMTAFNSKKGGFFLTTVGRVQTPTLSIVVDREQKISNYVSKEYWEIHVNFSHKYGFYDAKWYDPNFLRSSNDLEKKECRLWSFKEASEIIEKCNNKICIINESYKKITQHSPMLFDLTSLQREANSRFGFSAKTTLSLSQSLYEKHKLITYPRTDCRSLPEDYLNIVKNTLNELKKQIIYKKNIKLILDYYLSDKLNKRIFNNKNVRDHFAIIPTPNVPKILLDSESNIYHLIVKRFLSVFFPACEYRLVTRITNVSNYFFKTENKVLVNSGWRAVYKDNIISDICGKIDPISNIKNIKISKISPIKFLTKSPVRYTEGTLLSAMEGAGKLIEDDELKEALLNKGLGTPATRASIIEGLISEKYLIRKDRNLIPTSKAFQLMSLLRKLNIYELISPELTGIWEYKLAQIEKKQLCKDIFMSEIKNMTCNIVKCAMKYSIDTIPGDYITLKTLCLNCKNLIKENYLQFSCTKCNFFIPKIYGGRKLDHAEVEKLILYKFIGPLSGFRSKIGHEFSATLRLFFNEKNKQYKIKFDFNQNDINFNDRNIKEYFSKQKSIGECYKCNGKVFEYMKYYICENVVKNFKNCDFKLKKIILQQEISIEQIKKLLSIQRTDLLTNFKSSRTGKIFQAFLVRKKNGNIGFEFKKKSI